MKVSDVGGWPISNFHGSIWKYMEVLCCFHGSWSYLHGRWPTFNRHGTWWSFHASRWKNRWKLSWKYMKLLNEATSKATSMVNGSKLKSMEVGGSSHGSWFTSVELGGNHLHRSKIIFIGKFHGNFHLLSWQLPPTSMEVDLTSMEVGESCHESRWKLPWK